jgi:ribosomal protein L7/L12
MKTGIPSQAIIELQQGRKIEAIRIVREEQGLGLKEAKDAVEAYVRTQPALQKVLDDRNAEAKSAFVKWILIIAAAVGAAIIFLK